MNIKTELHKLKFDRVINNFLSGIIIETVVYDTVGDDVYYSYDDVTIVYIDEGSKEIEIMMGDILKLLDLEYVRYIYNRIVKFISKPKYNIVVYYNKLNNAYSIEEYEKINR